nr:hypothetical protein [Cytophagales bacterium]
MIHKEVLRSIVFITVQVSVFFFPEFCLANDTLNNPPLLGPPVISLILVNADTNQDIEEINDGDVFVLEDIGTSNLSVRAEVGPTTESVVFAYQGVSNYKLENVPVYAIAGDNRNDYNAWVPDLGANVITATAYTGDNRTGLAGEPLTVNFQVVESRDTPPTNPVPNLPVVVRINSGGPTISYNDSTFLADDFFAGNGGGFSKNFLPEIFGTTQDEIYKSERRANASLESFAYNIPVTNGSYVVNLHFAETYFGATSGGAGGTGRRVFNVILEEQAILTNFDINAQVSPMTALIETFTTTVTDQSLDLIFSASVNQPKVSAIEVFGEGSLITDTVDDVVIQTLDFTNCPPDPIFVGDVVDFDLAIFPENTTNQTVIFTASDGSTIDDVTGVFTALSPGEITVTATSASDDAVLAQCTITILDGGPQLGPAITSLVLVNADTDQDIEEINDGDVFVLEDIGTSNLSVRAEVGPTTESVVFAYQGVSNYKLENVPVYAIA